MTRRLVLAPSALAAVFAVGCLDYQSFLDKKRDRECEELAKCNPDIPCQLPYGSDTGYGNDVCDFDRDAAKDCLHGSWRCADVDPHFMYVIPPEACALVCGEGSTGS